MDEGPTMRDAISTQHSNATAGARRPSTQAAPLALAAGGLALSLLITTGILLAHLARLPVAS
jgi:hypothetical protein